MIECNHDFGAINLLFNKVDAENLIMELENFICANREVKIPAIYKKNIIDLNFCIGAEDDFLSVGKKEIKIIISTEKMDYLFYKLSEFIKDGDFYPSELGGFVPVNSSLSESKKRGLVQVFLLKKRD